MKDPWDTKTPDLFEKAEPEMPDLFETAGIPLVNDRGPPPPGPNGGHAKETDPCQK